MKSYRCSDGDRIDLIVLKHYGDLKHLNDVIGANNHLCKKPLTLTSGEIVELPDFSVSQLQDKSVTDQAKERVPLW